MITHLNKQGNAKMVDVTEKTISKRKAMAQSVVTLGDEAYKVVKSGYNKKGDILSVAQVSGIMAAKNTSQIIPLCHPLSLTHIDIEFMFKDSLNELIIQSTVETEGKTGVEMEALTATSICALTIYDMVKAVDKSIVIKDTKLLLKKGGKSDYEG